MNCIVVDDESVSREILAFLCSQEPNLEVVGTFTNAMDAFIFLNKEQVDLIFLDIHMPGFSGFDFLQTLKGSSQIILTTSDKESALKAFEYENIVAFLIKPIDPNRFKKAILKVEKILNIPSVETSTYSKGISQFYINIDKRLIKLNSEDVNMIEAKGDYVLIHLDDKEYRVHTTLSKIKTKLPSEFFFQVHRSYIINLSKIIDIQDNTILIQKFVIPISRSRRAELMNKLNLI
ncbi:LytR/AlgR family response regulator transcription factor [Algoriphagus aquimarinus]|uniref:Response regulator transcription factor n=1 Tax=Algoriphagus aquimarinus TaxID=237018 RepID=A0A5C7AVM2_9BACT|nr:LytTR family DNA-binding domain-containing protein [Algoriphagus aquimarinus]TXE12501.1 response regulator transcription factor [Algoriphagus aquimarinus]